MSGVQKSCVSPTAVAVSPVRELTTTSVNAIQMFASSGFMAGAFSAGVSSAILQPLDMVKTRQQMVIGAVERRAAGYGSIVSSCSQIARTDGVRGLWRGITPTLQRVVPGAAIHFSLVSHLTATVHQRRQQHSATGSVSQSAGTNPLDLKLPASHTLAIGGVSRGVATCALLPITLVKVRSETGQFQYRGTGHALRSIIATEGVSGLYRGLGATLLRDMPYAAIYLFVYQRSKFFISEVTEVHNFSRNFSSGVLAGLVASSFSTLMLHPWDLAKTRIQVHKLMVSSAPPGSPMASPSHPASVSPSVSTVLRNVWRYEGFSGLFTGAMSRTLRKTMMSALTWAMFEEYARWNKRRSH